MPVTDSVRIAELMQQHLRCALPDGLEGPVYLSPPDPGAVAQISGQLRTKLARTPFAAVTRSPEEADWVLSVQVDRSGGRIHQLQLLLEDGERQVTQQVAAVYVVGLESDAPQPDTAVGEMLAQTPARTCRAAVGDAVHRQRGHRHLRPASGPRKYLCGGEFRVAAARLVVRLFQLATGS